MELEQTLTILRNNREELRRRGAIRAAVFGSVARGEAGSDSDIDILIELDETDPPDVFSYAGLIEFISNLFSQPVDVVNRTKLKPHIRPSAELDAIYAF
jgi:hypothetical protein